MKFDLDSPKMAEAIRNLGLVNEDLNTQLKRENFPHDDQRVTELQFKHYQRQLLETINNVLIERKRLRTRKFSTDVVIPSTHPHLAATQFKMATLQRSASELIIKKAV